MDGAVEPPLNCCAYLMDPLTTALKMRGRSVPSLQPKLAASAAASSLVQTPSWLLSRSGQLSRKAAAGGLQSNTDPFKSPEARQRDFRAPPVTPPSSPSPFLPPEGFPNLRKPVWLRKLEAAGAAERPAPLQHSICPPEQTTPVQQDCPRSPRPMEDLTLFARSGSKSRSRLFCLSSMSFSFFSTLTSLATSATSSPPSPTFETTTFNGSSARPSSDFL
mmetsp:Transcript_29557/g.78234  ORF Transcript_29557/g.78234 Transcript_29557/m.78234 type:complete len:219 (+) Transcript_29557:1355-2011(+)